MGSEEFELLLEEACKIYAEKYLNEEIKEDIELEIYTKDIYKKNENQRFSYLEFHSELFFDII